MIKTYNIKQNIINIVVFLVCIVLITSGNYIISQLSSLKASTKTNIETEWRVQAKRQLSNLQDQFMYDVNHNTVDPLNEQSLQLWAKRNISGVLNGGNTGEAFMINLSNEKFIWDNSPICDTPQFITNGRYMKDESELHVDKIQASTVISKMRQGISTINTYDKNWWNVDGSPEYLEWIVIPSGFLGFGDESKTTGGVKNGNYHKVLIALGTQKDEVEATFSDTFKEIDTIINITDIFVALSIIICIFNMIIYVFLNQKGIKKS